MALFFRDREDAGRRLARALFSHRDARGVVIAIPCGGVVVGAGVAEELGWPLDLVCARKIGDPLDPEHAIAAITEDDDVLVQDETAMRYVSAEWFRRRVLEERREARRRRALYLAHRPPCDIRGREVILVDDGVATGLTMRAAIRSLQMRRPARLTVAVPIAPRSTIVDLGRMGADVLALLVPSTFFGAISSAYSSFAQVTDVEVRAFLSMDIFSLLKREHAEMRVRLHDLETIPAEAAEDRRQIFQTLERLLLDHAYAERVTLYPRLAERIEVRDEVEEANELHVGIERRLRVLEKMNPGTREWLDEVHRLKRDIEEHIKQEEGPMHMEAQVVLSSDELESLGGEYDAERKKR